MTNTIRISLHLRRRSLVFLHQLASETATCRDMAVVEDAVRTIAVTGHSSVLFSART